MRRSQRSRSLPTAQPELPLSCAFRKRIDGSRLLLQRGRRDQRTESSAGMKGVTDMQLHVCSPRRFFEIRKRRSGRSLASFLAMLALGLSPSGTAADQPTTAQAATVAGNVPDDNGDIISLVAYNVKADR